MSLLLIDRVYTPYDVYSYADNGAVDQLKLALVYGNNSTEWYRDENGQVAGLHKATKGHIECMCELLYRGADIESKQSVGLTALMLAAQQGQIECMRELLDRGADIESKSNNGWTALFYAGVFFPNSTRLLLDRGAFIDEDKIKDAGYISQECKQMILDEVPHRLRRAAFDSFINHHIKYQPHIDNIYSICYPSGDLRVALPAVGWHKQRL